MNPRRILRTALIVEDDEALSQALVRFATDRGIAAHAVTTLANAELVRDQGFDLALVDVKLPDGSGVDLCRSLCASSPKPVVVAISGSATAREGFALARAGVGEFVEKPFDEADLWAAIEKNAGVPIEVAASSSVGNVKLPDATDAVRRVMIGEALARTETITAAAKLLGVSRQAVQQAMDDLE